MEQLTFTSGHTAIGVDVGDVTGDDETEALGLLTDVGGDEEIEALGLLTDVGGDEKIEALGLLTDVGGDELRKGLVAAIEDGGEEISLLVGLATAGDIRFVVTLGETVGLSCGVAVLGSPDVASIVA